MSGFSFYTPEIELDLSREYRSYVPAFYGKHLTFSIVYAYRMLYTTLTFMNLLLGVTTMTGVNFVPQNEFYSTYSMWALSFSVDLLPYYDNIAHINDTTMTLKTKVTSEIDRAITKLETRRDNDTSTVPYSNELLFLRVKLIQDITACETQTLTTITRLYRTLDTIRTMYTSTTTDRRRRSLLPWAGDILSSLFGTATKTDMTRLRERLNGVIGDENELVHIVENSLTLVNKTNAVSSANRRAINQLSLTTSKLDKKMRRLHNLALDRVMIQDVKIEITNKVSDMTSIIYRTLRRISGLIDRLADNMDSALHGKLATTLVEPNELRSILNGISKRIPNSLTVKESDGNDIMWYYKHLPITVISDQNKIHLVTVIPLIPVESLFTLYKVVALPIPIAGTNRSTLIKIEGTHFAVSRQGNSYVILDDDELTVCSKTDATYCPLTHAAMNLARMPSCLGSLYLGEQHGITTNCPVTITDNQKFPIFRHLVKGKWMIASRDKITIHPRCDTLAEATLPVSVIPPMQVITLPSGCTGYTEFAKMSPYFYESSTDSHALAAYRKLNIGEGLQDISDIHISNYSYDYQLTNSNPVVPDQLPSVDDIDIDHLMDKLDKLHKQKYVVSKSSNLIGVIVGIISVVGLGLVTIGGIVMYKFRSVRVKHKYSNVKVNETNDNVEVDSGHVELSERSSPARMQESVLDAAIRGARPDQPL